jgi:hypothetical protein
MKLNIKNGRIIRIEGQKLNPVLPTTDLSFIENKDLYKEIRNYIKNGHPNLENRLIFQNGAMKHSNPHLAVAVDMYLKNHAPGYRLATQAGLETDLSKFKGFYVDSGMALRNLTGANSEQAEHIFSQLKQRGVKLEDFPIWLNLRGLELDGTLNFNLTDESVYSTENSLNWESGTRYSKINKTGLPREADKNSDREIWTANHALSRGYLDRGSNLYSNYSVLSCSDDGGRVVVARIA